MWVKLFSLIIIILFSALSVHADTHNAASCSYADVSAAITAATVGDTVTVPAGLCTWSSTLTITKGINLIGAGVGSTVITNNTTGGLGYSGKHCWSYVPSNYTLNTPFRISGFTIDLDNKAAWLSLGTTKSAPFTIQTNIRIDHNSIINVPNNVAAGYIWAFGDMHGVVDNNNFSGAFYGFKSDPQIVASYAWYSTSPQKTFVSGSSNYLYYEDNTISLTTGDNLLVEGQYGGRHAWRYNTITGGASSSLFEAHGHQGTGALGMPAVFGVEVYGNRITNSGGNLTKTRGGKSFVFYNSVVNAADNVAYDGLLACPVDTYDDPVAEMIHDTYWWGSRTGYTGALTGASVTHTAGVSCNGLSNIPTSGRDVFSDNSSPDVSCGTLANIPGTCSIGQGYWATNQSCSDLTGMVGVNPTTTISGTFYKCTSTDNWESFYTPYTYPHPLRDDGLAPTIASATSTTPNGTYGASANINVTVTFSKVVTSTGNVTDTLETGATDRICTFTVTNSLTGSCNYIVQSGDASTDLTVNTIAGTIVDQYGNAMVDFTIPNGYNMADSKAIVISTTPGAQGALFTLEFGGPEFKLGTGTGMAIQ